MEISEELKNATAEILAKEAVKLMLEKKALDVKLFKVTEYTSITDYYVNVTGRSSTHVASLADDIAENFSSKGKSPYRVEGKRGNSWILVDFGSLILNVFDAESRSFYNFYIHLPSELQVDISDLISEVDKKFT